MNSLDITAAGKPKWFVRKPHQFLHVWILREYLNLDLRSTNLPEKFEYDIERLIDDFIFICFFGGNDFLPHMPTLEFMRFECFFLLGGINLLIHVYKQEFKNLGGYLVNMEKSGNREEELFPVISTHNQKGSSVGSDVCSPYTEKLPDHDVQMAENTKAAQMIEKTKALKEQLKSYNREISDVFRNGLLSDMVKLGTPGWRKRYYKYKFSAETEADMENTRKEVVEKYTEGLCWVLLYYFSGVASWTWFYPFHYGPFASDFKGLSSTKVMFQIGSPFKPFDHLMSVLPPTSAHALPPPYRSLMTSDDSNILDFYPDGYDLAVVVSKEFATAFPDRTFISPVVDLLTKNGQNGKNNGKGYYVYEKGSKPKPDNMVLLVIEESRRVANLMPQGKTVAMTDEEIVEMVLFPVVNEACRVLEEKIVVKASDLDIAFVLGMSFPSYRGGIVFWADVVESKHIYTSLKKWFEKYGNFYKPSRFLEERAMNGVPLSAPINTGSRAQVNWLLVNACWIKFNSIKPTIDGEAYEIEDASSFHMVLVQIPICNEREVTDQSQLLVDFDVSINNQLPLHVDLLAAKDYLTLGKAFIMNYNLTSKYDFHTYMIRSMEEEFQRILVLLVGTKLQHVIATLALESDANTGGFFAERRLKPRDEIFWFKKPELLLNLIHFILFQDKFVCKTRLS
ncbi:unnamed protein product [Lactuca virosa]|uniref:Xrn1 helical domain-containing protein n=1 Tax=Lactuca virosa TaxID=75947 RepID=A0AAU9PJ91_9ASTR|nr:unnamed protein product [Lactuca virosa]